MAISTPDMDGHPVGLADWLELHVLASGVDSYPVENLVAAWDPERDEESENIGDDDAYGEDLMQRAANEILRRCEILGEHYPFFLSEDGALLTRCEIITPGGYVYLFCLWLSQANDGGYIGSNHFPITNRDRDLFQVCATLAAAGFLEGHAHSFGWPRADESGFIAALNRTYSLLGEGRPKPGPRFPPGVSRQTKDAGIDVIAWRDVPDRTCGRLYLLGQAASGRNWQGKSITHLITGFHDDFFLDTPPSPPIPALFVPFCLQDWADLNPDYEIEEAVNGYLRRQTRDFGILFFRYRMAYYAAKGLELAAAAVVRIERAQEFASVRARVDSFLLALQADRPG